MWMMPGDWGWGWAMVGWLWMLLFWGGIIALVIWVINRLSAPRAGAGRSPVDILKERYARGELSKEQFEQMRKDLS